MNQTTPLMRPVFCHKQVGCSAFPHGGSQNWVAHPAEMQWPAAMWQRKSTAASQGWELWQLCYLGGFQEAKCHYQDWSGAGLLLQPPRRHTGLLISPRGLCLKGSGAILRRLLRLPALGELVPALGGLVPVEKVWRHWGMAWESVETIETEKGSYFPNTSSAPGKAAAFPRGLEGSAWYRQPDKQDCSGNQEGEVRVGGRVGNDRERQPDQRKRNEKLK